MGFFSRIKKIFGAPSQAEEQVAKESASEIQQEPEQLSEQQHEQQAAQMAELEIREPVQPEGAQQRQEEAAEKPASPETEQAGDVPQQTQIVSAEEGGAEEEKEKPLSAESVIQPVEEAKPAMEKSEDADKKGEASVSPEDASEVSEEVVEVREVAEPAEAAKPAAALDPWAAFKPVEEAKTSPEPEQVTEASGPAAAFEATVERSGEAEEKGEAPEEAPKVSEEPVEAREVAEPAEAAKPAVRPEAGAQKSEGTDEKPEGIGAQETEQKAGDKAAEAVEPVKAAIDPWAAFRPAEEAKEAFEPEKVTEESEPAVRYEAGAQKSEGTEEKFEAPEAASEAGQEAAAEGQKVLEESAQASSEKPCAEEEGPAPAAVQEQQTAQEPMQDAGQKAEEGGEDEIIIDLGAPLMPEDWEENRKKAEEPVAAAADFDYPELTLRLREAEAKLSVWLDIVLDGVSEAGDELNRRVTFLLRTLEAPADEAKAFVDDFAGWLERMEYRHIEDFRSELQYRLALALDLEDEEDERSRLFLKLSNSLAKTRAQFARHFEGLISSHGELDDEFWEQLEEIFIMADLGVEAAMELTERLRTRAREQKVTTSEGARELLREEIRSIFARPRHIVGITPPEVVLMIGVNGAGKTTTIAKLAYRDRMQGKKVMIAAADTFRAAAIEQLQVWANRVGALFHAKQAGSDPASVAYEAMDRAMSEGVDVLYVDTAGRLQTKVNLMDELAKIRNVIARKHPGAPHRTVLVLDATTGQNALSQAKLFKESAGVDELILTKLDGTAKGGVAIAVAMQHKLPITYVGLGEKVEDLRPFNGDDYAEALLKI